MFFASRFGEGLSNSDIAREARKAAENKRHQPAPIKRVTVNEVFARRGRFL